LLDLIRANPWKIYRDKNGNYHSMAECQDGTQKCIDRNCRGCKEWRNEDYDQLVESMNDIIDRDMNTGEKIDHT